MNKETEKYMSVVTVGERGQIVIPKKARDMFNIKAGDSLLVLADSSRGIALVRNDQYFEFATEILKAQAKKAEKDD